jgi:hypothetical protein
MFYRTRFKKNILCRNVVFLSSYEFVWGVCFVFLERRTMYLRDFV